MAETGRFDVIIVGGGPVGLSLALALTRFCVGLSVALVDRRALSVPKDARASAIAAGVRRVFDGLGVWGAMAGEAEPVQAMKLTDSGTGDLARPLLLDFGGEVAPGEAFAHLVPNSVIGAVLLEAVGDAITVIAPAEIAGLTLEGRGAELDLIDGRRLVSPLLVAADGAQSILRGMAGIEVFSHDYRQTGIATTFSHEFPHEGVAYEHFRPGGPFATLPLRGNRSSLVWTERRDAAERLLALSPGALSREIETAMGHGLGTVAVEGPVMGYPLKMQIARSFVAQRFALVGDAAHVIHPIAGQGLNLGLKDVAALAEVVVEAARLGMDIGAEDVLARYERWRRFDTASMALVTDGMNRLFSNDIGPVRAVRDFGLSLVDRAGPVKDAMIRIAAGLEGNGPRLLSGQGI